MISTAHNRCERALSRFSAFDDLLGSMAFAYADCVVSDHRHFCQANAFAGKARTD